MEWWLSQSRWLFGLHDCLIILVRQFKDLRLFWLVDRVAILAVMAGGFIRLGNLFNSEILGRVTNVPWAFKFVKVDNLPRHPTQIYESLAFFFSALVGYLYYRYHKRNPKKDVFLVL